MAQNVAKPTFPSIPSASKPHRVFQRACTIFVSNNQLQDFPGGIVDKNPPASANAGSIPGPGRSQRLGLPFFFFLNNKSCGLCAA